MRILKESELNYSIEDIVSEIQDDLGFSIVMDSETKGHYLLGAQIRLFVDFDDEGEITTRFVLPMTSYDMSSEYLQVEMISTAIESASQIVEVIKRMTSEGVSNEESY